MSEPTKRIKTPKKRILAWVPEELAERLDVARDGRPMGVYVARLLEQGLGAKDRSRFRGMIEEMQTTNSVDAICDAYGKTRGAGPQVPAQFMSGWDLALRELLRRLEEGA